jgi:hypothetical protein
MLPTYQNSLEWEKNCVALKRQLRSGKPKLFQAVAMSAAPKMIPFK